MISIPLLENVPDLLTLTVLPLALLVLVAIHFARPSNATRRTVAVSAAIVLPVVCFATHLGQARAFFVASHAPVQSTADWSKAALKLQLEKDPGNRQRDWWGGIGLLMSVDGLPPEVHLRGEGETRIDGLPRPVFSFLLYSPDRYGDQRDKARSFRNRITVCYESGHDPFRGRNVSIHTSLDVWAFEEETIYRANFSGRNLLKIPGLGLCREGLHSGLNCWFGPLRPVDVAMKFTHDGVLQSWPISSFMGGSLEQQDEIIWGFSPIEKLQEYLPEDVSDLPFTKLIPVGRFHTTFSSAGFPISEYGIHKALTAPLE